MNASEMTLENRVFATLRKHLIDALDVFGTTGFSVQRFAQAEFTGQDGLVLLAHTGTTKEGFEWCKDKWDADTATLNAAYGWLESHTYDVTILKRMRRDDGEDTITGEDVACQLINWLNGPGVEKLLADGISILRIDGDALMLYNDDSDLYQRRVVFEMKIVLNKGFTMAEPSLDILGVKTKPI